MKASYLATTEQYDMPKTTRLIYYSFTMSVNKEICDLFGFGNSSQKDKRIKRIEDLCGSSVAISSFTPSFVASDNVLVEIRYEYYTGNHNGCFRMLYEMLSEIKKNSGTYIDMKPYKSCFLEKTGKLIMHDLINQTSDIVKHNAKHLLTYISAETQKPNCIKEAMIHHENRNTHVGVYKKMQLSNEDRFIGNFLKQANIISNKIPPVKYKKANLTSQQVENKTLKCNSEKEQRKSKSACSTGRLQTALMTTHSMSRNTLSDANISESSRPKIGKSKRNQKQIIIKHASDSKSNIKIENMKKEFSKNKTTKNAVTLESNTQQAQSSSDYSMNQKYMPYQYSNAKQKTDSSRAENNCIKNMEHPKEQNDFAPTLLKIEVPYNNQTSRAIEIKKYVTDTDKVSQMPASKVLHITFSIEENQSTSLPISANVPTATILQETRQNETHYQISETQTIKTFDVDAEFFKKLNASMIASVADYVEAEFISFIISKLFTKIKLIKNIKNEFNKEPNDHIDKAVLTSMIPNVIVKHSIKHENSDLTQPDTIQTDQHKKNNLQIIADQSIESDIKSFIASIITKAIQSESQQHSLQHVGLDTLKSTSGKSRDAHLQLLEDDFEWVDSHNALAVPLRQMQKVHSLLSINQDSSTSSKLCSESTDDKSSKLKNQPLVSIGDSDEDEYTKAQRHFNNYGFDDINKFIEKKCNDLAEVSSIELIDDKSLIKSETRAKNVAHNTDDHSVSDFFKVNSTTISENSGTSCRQEIINSDVNLHGTYKINERSNRIDSIKYDNFIHTIILQIAEEMIVENCAINIKEMCTTHDQILRKIIKHIAEELLLEDCSKQVHKAYNQRYDITLRMIIKRIAHEVFLEECCNSTQNNSIVEKNEIWISEIACKNSNCCESNNILAEIFLKAALCSSLTKLKPIKFIPSVEVCETKSTAAKTVFIENLNTDNISESNDILTHNLLSQSMIDSTVIDQDTDINQIFFDTQKKVVRHDLVQKFLEANQQKFWIFSDTLDELDNAFKCFDYVINYFIELLDKSTEHLGQSYYSKLKTNSCTPPSMALSSTTGFSLTPLNNTINKTTSAVDISLNPKQTVVQKLHCNNLIDTFTHTTLTKANHINKEHELKIAGSDVVKIGASNSPWDNSSGKTYCSSLCTSRYDTSALHTDIPSSCQQMSTINDLTDNCIQYSQKETNSNLITTVSLSKDQKYHKSLQTK